VLRIVGGVLATLVGVGLIVFVVWWFKFRQVKSAFVDESLELELSGGKRVAGGDPMAGLTDEEEEHFDDDLAADAHDDSGDESTATDDKGKEKESLISLDDDEYETAKKPAKNLLT